MQVGESRAASLGHTSGISWVEGDAQVFCYSGDWWNFHHSLIFPETSFSWWIFWLLHCGFWHKVILIKMEMTWIYFNRNVVRVEEALAEAYRVLKPGGRWEPEKQWVMFTFRFEICRFMCLEFSKVTTPGLDSLYDFYSFQIIPPMGKVSSLNFGKRKGFNHSGDQHFYTYMYVCKMLTWSSSGIGWGLGLISVPGGKHQTVSSTRGICTDDQECRIQVPFLSII